MIIKFGIVIFVLISVFGCSSETTSDYVETIPVLSTISPTPTPHHIPTEITPLATVNANISNQLDPNHSYRLNVQISSAMLRLKISSQTSSQNILAQYELDTPITDETEFPNYVSTLHFDQNWLGSYLLDPINSIINWSTYPISEISGRFVINNHKTMLLVGACKVTGGRGQWCGLSTLWLFDLNTGYYKLYDTDMKRLYDLRFNHDGTEIIAEGCLEQPNAYFGWCGDSAVVRYRTSDGEELIRFVMTPEPRQ